MVIERESLTLISSTVTSSLTGPGGGVVGVEALVVDGDFGLVDLDGGGRGGGGGGSARGEDEGEGGEEDQLAGAHRGPRGRVRRRVAGPRLLRGWGDSSVFGEW